ncbi:MAG: type II toxin-antitoxin system ParD family antitoxin [Alkalinema sp. RU_4_3]|nr:type II toxin-antitoxin system ParD family antitoxin [Alkalinema sp. RU_4_3]
MMISLPPELEAFAHRQIEAGNYISVEELLVDGMHALIDRETIYQERVAELRQELQIGAEALERGESQDLDTAIDSLRQKMRQRHS